MPIISVRRALVPASVAGAVAALLAITAFAAGSGHDEASGSAPASASSAAPSNGTAGADARIRVAVDHALDVHQSASVPVTVHADANASQADLVEQKAGRENELKAAYSGAALAHELSGLDHAISEQQTGHLRVLGGGKKNLAISTVTIDGSDATVTGAVDTWSKLSFGNPDGSWHTAQPQNTLDFTMHLAADSSGRWTVDEFDWSFAPGTQP